MSNRERGKVQVNLSSGLFTHGYNLTKQHPNCHLYWCRILPLCKTVFHLYNSMGYSYVNLCKCAGMGGFVALSCIMRALQNACGATSSLTQTLTVRCGLSGDAHQLKVLFILEQFSFSTSAEAVWWVLSVPIQLFWLFTVLQSSLRKSLLSGQHNKQRVLSTARDCVCPSTEQFPKSRQVVIIVYFFAMLI